MALYLNLYKIHPTLSQYVAFLMTKKLLRCFMRNQGDKSIALDADVIDEFTTQLMRKKSEKWDVMKMRRKLYSLQEQVSSYNGIQENNKLEVADLDNELETLLRDAIDENNHANLKELLEGCIKYSKLPSTSLLLQALSICAQLGEKNVILRISSLCKEIAPEILTEYSNFEHYVAEAMWIKGNVNDAIVLFENVYRRNVYLRRRIRTRLKIILSDAIIKRSEAVLVNIIRFAERLIKEFCDYYPMVCIWEVCFLSEWFTDQSTALDLLRNQDGLMKVLSHQLPHIVAVALKNHQTEAIHRLVEVLIELKEVAHYKRILEVLFTYRLHRGDLRGCSEIAQWSLKQGVDLPAIQQEMFIQLLVTQRLKSLKILSTTTDLKTSETPSYKF